MFESIRMPTSSIKIQLVEKAVHHVSNLSTLLRHEHLLIGSPPCEDRSSHLEEAGPRPQDGG